MFEYGLLDFMNRVLTRKISNSVIPNTIEMSNHSEDPLYANPSSESFWEPGNYKKTTKRIEDGFKLCNDMVQLIQERCIIEKTYAKNLQNWSKKWNDIISKGPEYGTTEAAWKGVLSEADKLNQLHMKMKDKLTDNVIKDIKHWQKDNFHKSMINIREKKEIDDEFKRVQKPWARILERVNKAKQDYHLACKNERTLKNQERNAVSDTSISTDQLKKIQERVSRAKEEVLRNKERYEMCLKEINQINPIYIHEMTQVFDKCQEFEEKRLNFFKEILFNIHNCLNISNDTELPLIYEEYRHTIQNADATKDLKWWSSTYGVGMSMTWPQFESFSEEFREIIRDPKAKKVHASNDGITLINQHKFSEELPDNPDLYKSTNRVISNGANNINTNSNRINNNNQPSSNVGDLTFDEQDEDWDEDFVNNNETLVDNGELGVSVRALYDYEGAESDELSFKQGEIFEKLEDEDGLGWCKGRKDKKVGLYPANYVEVIVEKVGVISK